MSAKRFSNSPVSCGILFMYNEESYLNFFIVMTSVLRNSDRLKIFTWHIHGSYLYYLSQCDDLHDAFRDLIRKRLPRRKQKMINGS